MLCNVLKVLIMTFTSEQTLLNAPVARVAVWPVKSGCRPGTVQTPARGFQASRCLRLHIQNVSVVQVFYCSC